MNKRILLVEDRIENLIKGYTAISKHADVDVSLDLEGALAKLKSNTYDGIITDMCFQERGLQYELAISSEEDTNLVCPKNDEDKIIAKKLGLWSKTGVAPILDKESHLQDMTIQFRRTATGLQNILQGADTFLSAYWNYGDTAIAEFFNTLTTTLGKNYTPRKEHFWEPSDYQQFLKWQTGDLKELTPLEMYSYIRAVEEGKCIYEEQAMQMQSRANKPRFLELIKFMKSYLDSSTYNSTLDQEVAYVLARSDFQTNIYPTGSNADIRIIGNTSKEKRQEIIDTSISFMRRSNLSLESITGEPFFGNILMEIRHRNDSHDKHKIHLYQNPALGYFVIKEAKDRNIPYSVITSVNHAEHGIPALLAAKYSNPEKLKNEVNKQQELFALPNTVITNTKDESNYLRAYRLLESEK